MKRCEADVTCEVRDQMFSGCVNRFCPDLLQQTNTFSDWYKARYNCYMTNCKSIVESNVNFTQPIPSTYTSLINCYATGNSNLINFIVTLAVLLIIIN
jgi:hypothetical protein